jgi:selenium-binding protein 1
MFSNKLFIYDLTADPRKPKLVKTVDLDPTGYSGPHTIYAVPDGVLLAMLGKTDGGGPGALVLVDDDGNFKQAWPVVRPDGEPGYMYDVGIKPEMNRMISSSWAHPEHVKEGGGPEHAGKDVVVWDWKEKKILQVEEVDLAPLEVRWMHGPNGKGGYTNAAFGNSVWYWDDVEGDGHLEFHRVIELPENSAPADMRISYDNRYLYVSLWGGGKVQQYDISSPKSPKLLSEVEIPQPNMMKLTPDSRRLYVTNSLLSALDGQVSFGAWLIDVGPDGMKIDENFKPDFQHFATGPAGPHDMLLR